MFLVAQNFYRNRPPWILTSLAQRLGVSIERLEDIVDALKKKGLLAETAGDRVAYLPARDLETILLRDLYEAVRGTRSGSGSPRIIPIREIEDIARKIDEAIGDALEGKTIKDLVRSGEVHETEKVGG